MALAPLRLGISQGHGGSSVLEGARIFAKALSTRIGQPVKLQVVEGYDALFKLAMSGGAEVTWMPPFLHVSAVKRGATLAAVCVRNGALTYRSALVVRADSKIATIDDIKKASLRMAWTDPRSAAGYLFPRLHLTSAGVDPKVSFAEEKFVGSPLTACAAVADGQADMCACFVSELAASDPDQVLADVKRVYSAATWRLRVIAVTDAIPSDGIVISPHVDPALGARVRDIVLGYHTHAEGRDALAKLLFAEKMVPVTRELAHILEALAGKIPAP